MSKATVELTKRTIQVGIEATSDYTTIRVDDQAAFQDVCNQVALKQVTKKDMVVFFRIVIRFFGPSGQSRTDFIPSPFERVFQILDREQSSWAGETKLIFRDIRNSYKFNTTESQSPSQASSSVLSFLASGSGSPTSVPPAAGSTSQLPQSVQPQTQSNVSGSSPTQADPRQGTALDSGRIVFDGGCTEFLIGEKNLPKPLAEAAAQSTQRQTLSSVSTTSPSSSITITPAVSTAVSTSVDFSRYLGLIGSDQSAENTIFHEIENIGTMYGRLEKKLQYRDGWRSEWCIVDEDRFWYSRVTASSEQQPENRHVSYIDLDQDTKAELESDTSHTFTISHNLNRSKLQFRASSRSEGELWVKAIKRRANATSENEYIAHSEVHASVEEEFAAREDIDMICNISSLEGTLRNPSTRDMFQKFLVEEHSEEYLLFWEHCEDYYRHHPATKEAKMMKKRSESKSDDDGDDEDGGNDDSSLSMSSPLLKTVSGVRHWASCIYSSFVKPGSAHEVSMSSADRLAIERLLEPQVKENGKSESIDKFCPTNIIFRPAQYKALSFIRGSMWTRFVDRDDYRKMLVVMPHNARKHFRDMHQLRINILMDKNRLNHSLTLPAGRSSLRVTLSGNEKGIKEAMASATLLANSSNSPTTSSGLPVGPAPKLLNMPPSSPSASVSDRIFRLFKRRNTADMEQEWNQIQGVRKTIEKRFSKASSNAEQLSSLPSIEFGWKGNLWWDRVEFESEDVSLDVTSGSMIMNQASPSSMSTSPNAKSAFKVSPSRSSSTPVISNGSITSLSPLATGGNNNSNNRFMKVYPAWAPRSVDCLDNAIRALNASMAPAGQQASSSSMSKNGPIITSIINPMEADAITTISATMMQTCEKSVVLSERLRSRLLMKGAPLDVIRNIVSSLDDSKSQFRSTPISRIQGKLYRQLINPEYKEQSSYAAVSHSSRSMDYLSSSQTPMGLFRRSIPKFIGPFEGDEGVQDYSSLSKRPTSSNSDGFTVEFNKRSGRALQLMSVSTKGLVVSFGWMKCAYVRGASNSLVVTSSAQQNLERQTSSAAASPKQLRPEEVKQQKQLEQMVSGVADDDDEAKLRGGFAAILQVASSEYQRKFVVLIDFLGTGELHLFDPDSSVPAIIIMLQCASRVGLFEGQLHSIQIIDEKVNAGVVENNISWILCTEGTDEDDAHTSCKRWIEQLAPYTRRSELAVRILLEGVVSKRGKFNTGFKRRWMILSSDFRLFYYKEETGSLKGEIQVCDISEVKENGKDFSITTPDRVWQMSTDTSQETRKWVVVLLHIMNLDKRLSLQLALTGLDKGPKKDWKVIMS